jgi:putative spermidine/putrescine transport system ATP-binding protein
MSQTQTRTGAVVQFAGVVKTFGTHVALSEFDLTLAAGELVALLGPSGSGKTTALRVLAGLESTDDGRILIDGDNVSTLPTSRRDMGMVFQSYSLFPHLSAGQNVEFGLRMRRVPAAERRARAAEALALVGLDTHYDRFAHQLSGGQQQRVALARALVTRPRVLLLDEPLSNLDPSLRERTRRELRELIRRLGITTVLVTHEQEEAFDLGDRVAVMRQGRLEQVGTPDEIYARPANLFVGGFVGRSSVLPVMVLGSPGDDTAVRIGVEGVEWEVDAGGPIPAGPAEMLVRPEALRFAPPGPAALPVTVTGSRFVGPGALFTATTGAGVAIEVMAPVRSAEPGARIALLPSRRAGAGIHLYPVNPA